jgi:L-fucose isomerase-like protein
LADLFRRNRDRIDGIIVTLPNFGEERAIAGTLGLADLRVPVLIQAPDDLKKMTIAFRRDSFLRQDVSPQQSAAVRHSVFDHDAAHGKPRSSLRTWSGSLRYAEWSTASATCAWEPLERARQPSTVRYSEKIVEAQGISIETLDLSAVLGRIERMKDNDDAAQAKLAAIRRYVDVSGVPRPP